MAPKATTGKASTGKVSTGKSSTGKTTQGGVIKDSSNAKVSKARARAQTPNTPKTKKSKANRSRKAEDTDAAGVKATLLTVDGVCSPAKGDTVQKPKVKPVDDTKLPCPRFKFLLTRKWNLQEHFPICVRRNGNPDSLRHDDPVAEEMEGAVE